MRHTIQLTTKELQDIRSMYLHKIGIAREIENYEVVYSLESTLHKVAQAIAHPI